jgi:hypothetical protein
MTDAKITDRIKKLLALSSSSNEHEAAAAAAQAADLMARHHIDMAMLDDHAADLDPVEQFDLDTSRKRVAWKGLLAHGVCRACGCDMFYHTKHRATSRSVSIKMVGRKGDLDAVRYMYHYLTREVDRLAGLHYRDEEDRARLHGKPPPNARSWKNGFRLGASNTIATRLNAQREQSISRAAQAADSPTAQALVRVRQKEQEIQWWMEKNLTTKKRTRAVYTSRDGFRSGRHAGETVHLSNDDPRLGAPAPRLGARQE